MGTSVLIFLIVIVGLACAVHFMTTSPKAVNTGKHTLEVSLQAAQAAKTQIADLADTIQALQSSGELEGETDALRSVIVLQLSYLNDLVAVLANIPEKDGRPILGALIEIAYGNRYGVWPKYVDRILTALQEKRGAGVGTATWEAEKPFRDALLLSVESVDALRRTLRTEMRERGVVHHGTCQN